MKLKFIDKEFYLTCNDKPNIGNHVVERLLDGNSMLITIHNMNDIDLKNQQVIIASTRDDLGIPKLLMSEDKYDLLDEMILSARNEWDAKIEYERDMGVIGIKNPPVGSIVTGGEAAFQVWNQPKIINNVINIIDVE